MGLQAERDEMATNKYALEMRKQKITLFTQIIMYNTKNINQTGVKTGIASLIIQR